MTDKPAFSTTDLCPEASQLVTQLEMQAHPEGGFYKRCFTSATEIETPWGPRPSATMIYYLLPQGAFSQWHRLRQQEVWMYQAGDPVLLHSINPSAELDSRVIGPGAGHHREWCINGGDWFAAEPCPDPQYGYTLASCMVTPGFDFADFELGDKASLCHAYPAFDSYFRRLCRD